MLRRGGDIQVDGLNEAISNVKRFQDKGTLDAIKTANYEAAKILVTAAVPLTPSRSGNLRNTIKATRTLKYAAVRAGSTKVVYAGPIHWGWFYDKKFFIQKNIKPNPFLAKAYGYKKEQILANYKRNMEIAIKKYQL